MIRKRSSSKSDAGLLSLIPQSNRKILIPNASVSSERSLILHPSHLFPSPLLTHSALLSSGFSSGLLTTVPAPSIQSSSTPGLFNLEPLEVSGVAVSNATNSSTPDDMKSRIFIGNLNTALVTKKQLHTLFCVHGKIKAISMHKGYAFIQYTDEIDALNAVLGQDGHSICGQQIDVNLVTTPKAHQKSSKKKSQARDRTGKETSFAHLDSSNSWTRSESCASPSTSVSSTSSHTACQLSIHSNRGDEHQSLEKKGHHCHQTSSSNNSSDHHAGFSVDEPEKMHDDDAVDSTEIQKSLSSTPSSSSFSSSSSSQSSHTHDNLSGTSSRKMCRIQRISNLHSSSTSCVLLQRQDKTDGIHNCRDCTETCVQEENLKPFLDAKSILIEPCLAPINPSMIPSHHSSLDPCSSFKESQDLAKEDKGSPENDRMNDDSVNDKRHEEKEIKSSISTSQARSHLESRSLEERSHKEVREDSSQGMKTLSKDNNNRQELSSSSSFKRMKLDLSPSCLRQFPSSSPMNSDQHPDIMICGICKSLFTCLESFIEHKKGNNKCRLRFVCRCQPDFEGKHAL